MNSIKRFIPNKEDDLHCFQSCFQMIYETLVGTTLTDSEVEQKTNFVEGLPTWPFSGMISFMDSGLTVNYIEDFPYSTFIVDQEKAIRLQFTNDTVSQHIIDVTDFDTEVKFAKLCFNHARMSFEKRSPTLSDIKNLIYDGFFIIANVNSLALLGEEQYSGHSVIVEKIYDDFIILQNPGLPPIQNQKVTKQIFMNAWNYPDKKASNILAVKK